MAEHNIIVEYDGKHQKAVVYVSPPVVGVSLQVSGIDPVEVRTYAEMLSIATGFPILGHRGVGHDALAIFDEAPRPAGSARRIYESGVWWEDATFDLPEPEGAIA